MSTYQVDRARWARMTIFEQMGNIYSEVGRSLKTCESDQKAAEAAMIRALDLFDDTIAEQVKLKSPRAREVLHAKDQYLKLFNSASDDPQLDSYFMHFAIAARIHR